MAGIANGAERARELLAKARGAMEKYYDEAEVFNFVLDYLESQIA